MSFTRFDPKPLRSREQIAREVHQASLARGLDELATVIALMTISTEVGADDRAGNRQWWCPANRRVPATLRFQHDSESDDNRSSGYFQQQPGPNGEPWWGTPQQMMTLAQAANTFLERLAGDYGRAANNPRLAGEFAQRVQQSAYPDRYVEKWDEAWTVLRRALNNPNSPTPEVPMPVSGDPTWLEDVLRPALGDRLRTLPGWQSDGVGGTMGRIWGIIWHHTGNSRETAQSISRGRPDLKGPLAQIHIAPDGIVTIVAVGPCNHAGRGSYPGLPTNNANGVTIGIECAWPTIRPDGSYDPHERWPDAQIISMRDTGAAITKHLGVDVSHNISHQEWAGAAQGKWDPGNINMDWFRGEVRKDMDGFVFPGEHPPVTPPPDPTPVPDPEPTPDPEPQPDPGPTPEPEPWTPPDEIGERDDLLPAARRYLNRFSYGKNLGDSDTIDAPYLAAQRQFKNNVHFDVVRGKRPGPDVDPNSPAFDWATKKQMGLLGPLQQAPPEARPFIAYNFPGTWGAWNNGFGWDVCMRLDRARFDVQGLGYNTTAFLMGTTDHSYLDMVNDGANEYARLALPNRQRKILCGYSGGAGALVESLNRWPADRRDEIAAVIQFGDPNRPPGKTLLGNDPGGHGISEDFPPDWILDRYFSFSLPGDMYPNAAGLLPVFYDILVRMEATPEFANYLFTLLVDQLGNMTPVAGAMFGIAGTVVPGFGALAALLPLLTGGREDTPNLFSMLFNIPAIVISIKKLLDFLISGDHDNYGTEVAFDGMTAVDKAAQIVNALH